MGSGTYTRGEMRGSGAEKFFVSENILKGSHSIPQLESPHYMIDHLRDIIIKPLL